MSPPTRQAKGKSSLSATPEVTAKDVTETGKFGGRFIGTVPPHDLSDANDTYVYQRDMVYNVPVVIRARKGLPSFDGLTADTQVQAARKLIYHRLGEASGEILSLPQTLGP